MRRKKHTYVHEEEIIKALAENTVDYRIKNNMTQEELADSAEVAEVGIAQIKRIETGKVNTSISTAYRLAKALGVSMEDLLKVV